jgi:hypothetical protein
VVIRETSAEALTTSTSGGTLTAEGINLDFTYGFTPAAPVPGPIAGAGLPRPDLGWWWPSRLVATAEEDRLSFFRRALLLLLVQGL